MSLTFDFLLFMSLRHSLAAEEVCGFAATAWGKQEIGRITESAFNHWSEWWPGVFIVTASRKCPSSISLDNTGAAPRTTALREE